MKTDCKIVIFLLLIIGLITLMSSGNTQKLNIVGSTSVQPVCEELAEEYRKTNKNVDINIQGGGSSLSIKCISSDLADIGMSSKEINESDVVVHVLGREGIVLIVNDENPVNDLSIDQIKDIYSGEVTTWEDGSEINVIVREEGSGTLSVFKDKIMQSTPIKSDAIVQCSPGSIKQAVAEDKNAIGFIAIGQLDSSVKNISIEGISPSEENILDGSYILQRPFLLITNKTPSIETQKFINWTNSSEAKEILKSQNIITD